MRKIIWLLLTGFWVWQLPAQSTVPARLALISESAEAKRAYRWGLFDEAQAASESAWVLGDHDKDLATLRLRAYADAALIIDANSGNIVIPALPRPEQLAAIIRALTLFGQDAPLEFPGAASLDREWYRNGMHIFRAAVAMLDGYYQSAEIRAGEEDHLASLRQLTRQTMAMVETKGPKLLERTYSAVIPRDYPYSQELKQELDMYNLVCWDEGGLIYEKPEDDLPLFRHLLDEGYYPSELPRIIGWNREDRQRVPALNRQFTEELCASKAPARRLAGLSLSLMAIPFYPEAPFHECEQQLAAGLWDERSWIFSEAHHVEILAPVEDIWRDKLHPTHP